MASDGAGIHSFSSVADLLAYCATHPPTQELPVRVHGFYVAPKYGRGGIVSAVLLSHPEQMDDVERVGGVPAKIDFALNVAIPMGPRNPHRLRVPPPDRSWVTLEGALSWWDQPDGLSPCYLSVRSIGEQQQRDAH